MQIIRRLSDLAPALLPWREAGEIIALVPTMGALHAGHMALVEAARAEADRVVASIFVNPLQFGPTEDLDRYPRQEAEDAELLEQQGCDLLWLPTADAALSGRLCDHGQRVGGQRALGRSGAAGPFRRGGDGGRQAVHRRAARPGLLRRKGFPAAGGDPADGRRIWGSASSIRGVPTVRDADGLALSSRNAYLTCRRASARAGPAPGAGAGARGDPRRRAGRGRARRRQAQARSMPASAGSIISRWSMRRRLEPLDAPSGEMRLIAAAVIGTTRLIDNIRVISDTVRKSGSPRALTICLSLGREFSAQRRNRGYCTWRSVRRVPTSSSAAGWRMRRAGSVEALYELGVDLFDRPRRHRRRPDRGAQMVQPRRAVGRHPQPGLPRRNLDRDDRARNRRGAAPGPRLARAHRPALRGVILLPGVRGEVAVRRTDGGASARRRTPPPLAVLPRISGRNLSPNNHRHRAAVLGPGFLVGAGRDRPLLAPAGHQQPRRRHALRHQEIARRIGAPLAQRLVIFARAALVGMAFDRGADVGVGDQPARLRRQRRLRRLVERIFVGAEIDGVRSGLGDQVGLQRRQLDQFQAVGIGRIGIDRRRPAGGSVTGSGGGVRLAQAPSDRAMAVMPMRTVLFISAPWNFLFG